MIKLTVFSFVHPLKAWLPNDIFFTEKVIEVRPIQSLNAKLSIRFKLSGKVIEVRFIHFANV